MKDTMALVEIIINLVTVITMLSVIKQTDNVIPTGETLENMTEMLHQCVEQSKSLIQENDGLQTIQLTNDNLILHMQH